MIGKCSKDNKQVDETTGIKHYISSNDWLVLQR